MEPQHDKTNTMARLISPWASAKSKQRVAKDTRFLHVDSEDSDQTCRMPSWSESSFGAQVILFVLSCCGSWAWQNQPNDMSPSKDSDQPGHLLSLIRVVTVRMKKPWVLSFLLSECSYITGRMPRLFLVFAGCTRHFVDCVMLIIMDRNKRQTTFSLILNMQSVILKMVLIQASSS